MTTQYECRRAQDGEEWGKWEPCDNKTASVFLDATGWVIRRQSDGKDTERYATVRMLAMLDSDAAYVLCKRAADAIGLDMSKRPTAEQFDEIKRIQDAE